MLPNILGLCLYWFVAAYHLSTAPQPRSKPFQAHAEPPWLGFWYILQLHDMALHNDTADLTAKRSIKSLILKIIDTQNISEVWYTQFKSNKSKKFVMFVLSSVDDTSLKPTF